MKIFTFLGIIYGALLALPAAAQNGWPKTTTTANGTLVKLYEWQPESFSDNKLQARAAISVVENGKTDPVFGIAWFDASTTPDGAQVQVQNIYITDIRLPGEFDDEQLEAIAVALEKQAPSWSLSFSQSELQASLELNTKEKQLTENFSNTPPKVIYSNVPSILVLIDGTPRFQHNNDWGVDAVVNTPFAIVKHNNGQYYLYGGKHWYTAHSVMGKYSMTTEVPSNLHKVADAVNQANQNNQAQEKDANTIYNIIVSTEPAELIQTKGEANFAAVNGTGLLYVSNTENDIFMDVNTQQYYVLLSGRWYRSKTLSGNWQYTEPDHLPADFAKIPAGSPKDNILASVAGTPQAEDAVKEAQVPQTAKVDRRTAGAEITYDGDPQFELIDGTDMYYAVNTPSSVIRWRGRYYAVDNGIWFESQSAWGPWIVCVTRPHVVALIPPRYPVYYVKYVYVYDYTPDYVYVGYTPGYLNTYVSGSVVVYGTGYYYRPWYRHYYYPRPCTWGYGVRYNPWYGWGINVGFSTGWFHVNVGFGNNRPWGYWGYGGWWGPRVYRPPYCYSPARYGGYYGRGYYGGGGYSPYSANRGRNVNINVTNITYNNNIYRARRDVVITHDNRRYVRSYGRGNLVSNNRYSNTNRFSRVRSGERNALRTGNPADRSRLLRQYNSRSNNNANVTNRSYTRNSNNTFRSGRERLQERSTTTRNWRNSNNRISNPNAGTGVNSPSRERNWRNNDNNRITNPNAGTGVNSPSRERNWRNNDQRNNSNNNRWQNRTLNDNNRSGNIRRTPDRTFQPQNRERVRREFTRPDNNSRPNTVRRTPQSPIRQNRQPVRREFSRPNNTNRPNTIRRSPQRVIQPQNRESSRRQTVRPRINTNNNRSYRTPQMERRPQASRPPVRESVRRNDVRPRSSGTGGTRSSRGNSGGNHNRRGGRGN